MSDIELKLNGRAYSLACDAGGEARLSEVAAEVERRLAELLSVHGPVGDDRLLLMVAIQLADELMDRTAERDEAVARIPAPRVRKTTVP